MCEVISYTCVDAGLWENCSRYYIHIWDLDDEEFFVIRGPYALQLPVKPGRYGKATCPLPVLDFYFRSVVLPRLALDSIVSLGK